MLYRQVLCRALCCARRHHVALAGALPCTQWCWQACCHAVHLTGRRAAVHSVALAGAPPCFASHWQVHCHAFRACFCARCASIFVPCTCLLFVVLLHRVFVCFSSCVFVWCFFAGDTPGGCLTCYRHSLVSATHAGGTPWWVSLMQAALPGGCLSCRRHPLVGVSHAGGTPWWVSRMQAVPHGRCLILLRHPLAGHHLLVAPLTGATTVRGAVGGCQNSPAALLAGATPADGAAGGCRTY